MTVRQSGSLDNTSPFTFQNKIKKTSPGLSSSHVAYVPVSEYQHPGLGTSLENVHLSVYLKPALIGIYGTQ